MRNKRVVTKRIGSNAKCYEASISATRHSSCYPTDSSTLLLRFPYRVYTGVIGPGPTGCSRLHRSRPLGCKPYIGIGVIWLNCIILFEPVWRLIFITASLRGFLIQKPMRMEGIWSGCQIFKMNLENKYKQMLD